MSNLTTTLPSVTGYDYVGPDQPTNPEIGETWFDTSVPTGKVYDGSSWAEESAPSAGNALALSGGAYDVQEGGIALSNLSGYPVGTGDLAFDPATQTELDNHAGDSTAHHSKPTGTNSERTTTGRLSGFDHPVFDSGAFSDSGDTDGADLVPINAYLTEIQLNDQNGGGTDVTIYYADGSTATASTSSGANWFDIPDGFVTWVETHWSSGLRVSGVNAVMAGNHAHSI